jgi:ribosome-associated translation inhibitor RaiA
VSLGGVLSDSNATWFNETIKKLQEETPVVKQATATVVSIQDHIKRKASDCIGELEGQIDELITSEFKANVSPYATMTGMDAKGAHTKFIIDHFKTRRAEYDDVLTTSDIDIKEAYSNFTKTQLKKLIAYCDQVIVDGMKLAGEAVKTRKPRKRKAKSADQLIAKMNYAKDFAELKLVSIDPKTIIGASSLWVYNTKTRKLGVYQAADAAGLNVKGSTIQNFAESKSVSKKLRKPEATISEVLKGGKVALRSVLNDIRAVESALTGRINTDTILLRTVK